MDEVLNNMLRRIQNGGAILFVGAGFSESAINFDREVSNIPMAKQLANVISEIGEFKKSDDLKFAAEYFMYKNKFNANMKKILVNKFKDIFTVRSTDEMHDIILSVDWKRIYTTNYDNLIEEAAKKNGIRIESATIVDDVAKYTSNKTCIHINGFISRLDEEELDSSFKLSQSSYLSSSMAFENSNWHYIFKKDLENASAIIFIGYSLYDVEIEKILFENKKIKDKTYFIQKINSNEEDCFEEDFRYKKYGNLFRIGTKGFADLITTNQQLFVLNEEFYLEAFEKYVQNDHLTKNDISDQEVESFLKYGTIDNKKIEDAISTIEQKPPYLIIREKLFQLLEVFKENKVVCITSELGNGKSIFLKEAMITFSMEGFDVYFLVNGNCNYTKDIDKLISLNKKIFVLIDTYTNFKDLIKYITTVDTKMINFLIADRTSNHHLFKEEFTTIKTFDLNIDILQDEEISYFAKILESQSFWGKQGQVPRQKKIDYLNNNCKKQISLVLIDLLKSEHIKNAISNILREIFLNKEKKEIVFLVCLLDVMDRVISLSLISELSTSKNVFSIFEDKLSIRQFFLPNYFEDSVNTKSSIYSLHLLREHFEPVYTIERCLALLEELEKKFSNNRSLDPDREDIRINLFRYNFIEQILPSNQKLNMINKYYEGIKTRLPYHIENPQYWLQYAMAHIALGKYESAQRYLQTAYDKAKYKDTYDVHKIDNQQARLHIKIASEHSVGKEEAMKLFCKADALLGDASNNVYKYKIIAEYYPKFYEAKKNTFSKQDKQKIYNMCDKKLLDLKSIEKNDLTSFKQEYVYRNSEDVLLKLKSNCDVS